MVIIDLVHVNYGLGVRFKDYWMPDEEIKRLIVEVGSGGRQGRIPVAVDLDVCTVRQAGTKRWRIGRSGRSFCPRCTYIW